MSEWEAENACLRRELPEARMERDLLKKARTLPGSRCPVRVHEDDATRLTDLPYIPTDEGWLYLVGIKDRYTCEIVGYALGERMTKDLVGRALFQAVRAKRPEPG